MENKRQGEQGGREEHTFTAAAAGPVGFRSVAMFAEVGGAVGAVSLAFWFEGEGRGTGWGVGHCC